MASKENSNSLMSWIDRRFPVTENLERHLTKHPVPKKVNFYYLWSFTDGSIHDPNYYRNLVNDVLYKY